MRLSCFLVCLDLLFLLPNSERQPVAIVNLITLSVAKAASGIRSLSAARVELSLLGGQT